MSQQAKSLRIKELLPHRESELCGLLQGILSAADTELHWAESLALWLERHPELHQNWPGNSMRIILLPFLRKQATHADQKKLLDFMRTLVSFQGDPKALDDFQVAGKYFVFSGTFCRSEKTNYLNAITKLRGVLQETITKKTDYLVVGDNPAPSWNNSLYGKKIQRAQEFGRIRILSETLLAEGLEMVQNQQNAPAAVNPNPEPGE